MSEIVSEIQSHIKTENSLSLNQTRAGILFSCYVKEGLGKEMSQKQLKISSHNVIAISIKIFLKTKKLHSQ